MRKLALSLLLVSATAFADGQNVKLTYDAKGNAKVEAALKAEAEKHRDALETAANKKPFEIHVVAKLERKADDTKCSLTLNIFGAGGKTLLGTATGGASVKGPEDGAATDCVEAVLGGMLDKQVVATLKK